MWQAGDILHTINDVDVYRRPANEVAKRLLGRPGTRVKLGYARVFRVPAPVPVPVPVPVSVT